MTKQDIFDKLIETNLFNIDNQYFLLYVDLIYNNLTTIKIKYKTQQHHIIPKCYFKSNCKPIDNSNNNIVNLYLTDHILAHYYLALATNNDNFKYQNTISIKRTLNNPSIQISGDKDSCLNFINDLQKYKSLLNASVMYRDSIEYKNSVSEKLKSVVHTQEWNRKIRISHNNKSDEEKKEISDKISESNKDRVCITNGQQTKKVKRLDVEQYLIWGWRLGNNFNPRTSSLKGETKYTNDKLMERSLQMTGRKFQWSEEQKQKRRGAGNPMYGKHISQESKQKAIQTRINNNNLNLTPETKQKISNSLVGYVVINDGKNEYHIRPEQLDEYLNEGYIKGTIKRLWVHNDIDRHMILPDQLDEYLSNGYVLGSGRSINFSDDIKQQKSKKLTGTHWYTNGEVNIQCLEEDCPVGFYRGQTRLKKDAINRYELDKT